jgi:hypothetical protein
MTYKQKEKHGTQFEFFYRKKKHLTKKNRSIMN